MARTLIIAEAGVNHNGRLDLALQLCDSAKACGADVVKFQTWQTEKIITRTVAQADYQSVNTGRTESQFDMLRRLELSYDDFRRIKAHCDEIGITFASTADERWSLDFLVSLGIPFIKVGSGEITNIPYLRIMGAAGLPLIVSSGMADLEDVAGALRTLRAAGARDITLLHCTTNYPCPMPEVNLKAMCTLRDAFRLPVGYSDHTEGIEVPVAAVAMGACVIEKHFTLDKGMEGPDHRASTEPAEFRKMVDSIRNIEQALGNGVKAPMESEVGISQVVLKRILASRAIQCGEELTAENLCVKRNDQGIPAKYWDLLLGKKASRAYAADEPVDL